MFRDLLCFFHRAIRRLLRATGIGPQQSEKERLLSDIESLSVMVGRFEYGNGAVKERCKDLLKKAKTQAHHGEVGTGYETLHTVERESVFLMPAEAVAVRVESLQNENTGKLGSSWRSSAIRTLLKRRPISRESLAEAIAHRNTFDRNTHRKSDKIRMQLLLLLTFIILLVGLAIFGSSQEWFSKVYIDKHDLLPYAAYFGLLGGFLSSAMTLHATDRSASFQELSSNWYVLLARGLIGSAAAVVVHFILQTGIIKVPGESPSGYFVFFFFSGFSERWFLNTLATVTGDAKVAKEKQPAAINSSCTSSEVARHQVSIKDIMEIEMDAESDYFRANVGATILNEARRVLAFGRLSGTQKEVQLPQGGILRGEPPFNAVLREIFEETGIAADKLNKLDVIDEWLGYELPEEYRSEKTGRGQVQKWFLLEFKGTDSDIKVDKKEFAFFRWMSPEEVIDATVDFRVPVYRAVFSKFGLLKTSP